MESRTLFSFMMMSLDGYFEDLDGSIAWMNLSDDFAAFSVSQLNDIGELVFGRRTYDGMVSYWTSDEARASSPETSARMDATPKTVLSSTPGAAGWSNVTVVDGDAVATVTELKQRPGGDVAIFGSSTLTAHLLADGLVDELRVIVAPVLLGGGSSLFAGLDAPVALDLASTTTFGSGNVLLCYRPVRAT